MARAAEDVCARVIPSPKPVAEEAMETIEVDGLRIAYHCVGNGPPIVLLHGYVGDGPTTWRPQLEALSDDFTIIAWDAPGAGHSSDPPESFGIAGYADCLAGFVDRLGLKRPHVAGLSFGGALAIEFGRRHPAIPATLILVSAYAGWTGSLPAEVAEERLQQALVLADLSADDFVDALLPTMFSEPTPRESVDEFGATLRAFHPKGFRAMARASAEDLRDALPDIEVPTLLVYGDEDVRAPLSVAEHLHAAISNSTLVVLPGTGHLCNIEAPDAFNTAVRDFLRDWSN
jgi:pimeloyl-ACP methyl ester carboxylesterase